MCASRFFIIAANVNSFPAYANNLGVEEIKKVPRFAGLFYELLTKL
jgi:hypothetical protein